MLNYHYKKIILFCILALTVTSCSPRHFSSSSSNLASNQQVPSTEDTNNIIPTQPADESSKIPLAWEGTIKSSKSWSDSIYKVITEEEPEMLLDGAATDIEFFCPRYNVLKKNQRLNVWGQLFAAMAKFESGWDPLSRYVETNLGIDPVTQEKVVSEGLLQMSYQDVPNYNYICDFNWNVDKDLSPKDPQKTILNPLRNLRCGVRIMARQLRNKKAITLDHDVYWAVLKTNGKYQKIKEIAAYTKSLKFCE